MSIRSYFASKRSTSFSSTSHTDRASPGPSPSKQEKQTDSLSNASVIKHLDKAKPISPNLTSYPKKRFGKEAFERQFKAEWYEGRPWLEYIIELDACVCFPCRIYAPTSESPFVRTGFSNWKNAGTGKTLKGQGTSINLKGFAKHANSHTHKEAMKIWEEHKIRSSGGVLFL